MAEIKQLQEGDFGIFTIRNGEIRQIGLTESESSMLRMLLASFTSNEKPLVLLPKEYDLTLKNKRKNGN